MEPRTMGKRRPDMAGGGDEMKVVPKEPDSFPVTFHDALRKLLLQRAEDLRGVAGAEPLVDSIEVLAQAQENEIQRRLKEVSFADA